MPEIDPMMRAMFGQHARQAAFNYVVQGSPTDDRAAIIGTTTFAEAMSFGGLKQGIHTLVLCDVLIRPHLVIVSDHLQGAGAAGILTGSDGLCSAEPWLKHGRILINNLPKPT